jgi:uncharacterized protein
MWQLTDQDQRTLLGMARVAVETAVCGSAASRLMPDDASAALREKRGAFVTLHKLRKLRGCIGQIVAFLPLCRTVQQCAVSAALHDPRFPPVTPPELQLLEYEISVLSPLQDISPEEVVPGRHGLFISDGRFRGLLLPQVAVQWHWDAEQFLAQTCEKAGLPPDAWRHRAKIQGFTAQVFDEKMLAMTPPGSAA